MSELKTNTQMKATVDWDIQMNPIQDAQSGLIIPGWNQIKKVYNDAELNSLNDSTLHVAKESYCPPTTKEFQDYYHELSQITGFEPAGFQEWKEGKKIFGYLKNTQEEFSIDGHEIEDYLLIGVGYAGNTSFFVGSVNNLLRCSNEFGNINKTWKIRNTKGRHLKTEELISSFSQHINTRESLFDSFRKFKNVKVSNELVTACKKTLLGIEQKEEIKNLSSYKQNRYKELSIVMNSEMSQLGDNLWGMFNGATWYTTHNLKKDNSNIFGNVSGDKRNEINKKAFEFCLDISK